jgi:hypothetical protein
VDKLSEPEDDDDDDSDAVVGKPELITSALKKSLVKLRLLLHHKSRHIGNAKEGTAIKDHLFFHQIFSFPFPFDLYISKSHLTPFSQGHVPFK